MRVTAHQGQQDRLLRQRSSLCTCEQYRLWFTSLFGVQFFSASIYYYWKIWCEIESSWVCMGEWMENYVQFALHLRAEHKISHKLLFQAAEREKVPSVSSKGRILMISRPKPSLRFLIFMPTESFTLTHHTFELITTASGASFKIRLIHLQFNGKLIVTSDLHLNVYTLTTKCAPSFIQPTFCWAHCETAVSVLCPSGSGCA